MKTITLAMCEYLSDYFDYDVIIDGDKMTATVRFTDINVRMFRLI